MIDRAEEAALERLEPRELWSIFFSICSIPHPSRQEGALAEWMLARCRSHALEASRDGTGNIIMRVPATPGMEDRRGLVLQAHLDMVPQANESVGHDFSKDPIRPRLLPGDSAWLSATGTTLGADDGIGLAAALAFAESRELPHGPLECLFTVNEEAGMDGARGLAPGSVGGELLLNLDGEEEERITVGSAGGCRLAATFALPLSPAPAGMEWAELSIGGLLGGHSGGDIHLGRGNAILSLARILSSAGRAGARLASISGGGLPNAIPREAKALVGLPSPAFRSWRVEAKAAAAAEASALRDTDPGFAVEVRGSGFAGPSIGPEDSARLLSALAGTPNGLRAMSDTIPGLVHSSSNLGALSTARTEGAASVEALMLARSASDADKEEMLAGLEGYYSAAGAATRRFSPTSAWAADPRSPLLSVAREAYARIYGSEPLIEATHGGLECGLFRAAYPDWDMISIGPTIRFPHSPEERILIASVGRFWAFLAELARGAPRVLHSRS